MTSNEHFPLPVLEYTDDGRDVDDIEATAFLAGHENTEIIAVTTTHMIPDRRAMIMRGVLNHLGLQNTPIGVGSVYPIGKEDTLLVRYLREHTIQGSTYEGDGMIECFPPASRVIHDAIEQTMQPRRVGDEYRSNLRIAALAPLTDLALSIQEDRRHFEATDSIHIQGQAIVTEEGRLAPDPSAYNLKEDMEAAEIVFSAQDKVAFTFVGKHAAYQVPLLRSDFDRFAATGNQTGIYLRTHAIKGIECFAERAPDVFRKVFRADPSQLHNLSELSKPYDALVALNIARPDLLQAQRVGRHTLIGASPNHTGITPDRVGLVKQHLMSTILSSLVKTT